MLIEPGPVLMWGGWCILVRRSIGILRCESAMCGCLLSAFARRCNKGDVDWSAFADLAGSIYAVGSVYENSMCK